MNEILNFSFVISMFTFGLHYATLYTQRRNESIELIPFPQDREVLWFIRYYINKLPTLISKPLIGCIVCMAGPYSTLIYWGYIGLHFGFFHPLFIVKWLVIAAVVAGFNRVIKNIAQI